MTNSYKKLEKALQEQIILREIIQATASCLALNQVFKIICERAAKLFDCERVSIAKVEKKQKTYKWSIEYEYKKNKQIKGIQDIDFDPKAGDYIVEQAIMKNCFIESNIEQSNHPYYFRETYQKMGVRSFIALPIKKQQDIWGVIGLSNTTRHKKWSKKEINFLQAISNQAFIAIQQAENFQSIKKQAERNGVIKKIIETVGTTLDLEQILNIICEEILNLFKVERVAISKYPASSDYSKLTLMHESVASPEISKLADAKAPKEVFEYLGKNLLDTGQELAFDNVEESNAPEFYKQTHKKAGTKSVLSVPIMKGDSKWGIMGIFQNSHYRHWCEDEIDLLKTISNQVYIAVRQAELYLITKKQAERESLLRKIIEATQKAPDIVNIKQTIVDEIGRTLNADRCYFRSFDKKNNRFLPPDVEYLGSSDISGLMDKAVNQEGLNYFFEQAERQKEYSPLIVNQEIMDAKNLRNTSLEEYFDQANIKTDVAIPMWDSYEELYFLVLHYRNNISNFSQEDIELMQDMAKQAIIAINQSVLYLDVKQTAERETLLRKLVETIRGTVDIDEVKRTFVTETGLYFNADRVTFAEYDTEKQVFLKTDENSEFLSDNAVSFIGSDWGADCFKPFTNYLLEQREIKFADLDEYLKINDLENTSFARLFKEWQIKSSYNILLSYGNEIMGFFCIDYTSRKAEIDDKGQVFLETLSSQASTALYQTKLYRKIKQTAEREALLRRVTETIRSSLDIDNTLTIICDEVAKLFNVQRATIVQYPDTTNYSSWIVRREYKERKDVKGLNDIPYDKRAGDYIGKTVLGEGKNLIIDNIQESNTPDYYKNSYKLLGVKSALSVPIRKDEDRFGIIYLSATDKYRHWTKEEVKLLETISSQVYIAIKQSELYAFQKDIADREKILREIISELRPLEDLELAFNYLLKKISMIFNSKRTVLIEISTIDSNKIYIKYEYLSEKTLISLKDTQPPKACINMFNDIGKNLQPIEVNDVKLIHSEDKEIQDFFKKYSISSFTGAPLVRYNHETRILGILFICYDRPKIWTENEVNLFKIINDSVANILWEIIKVIETNKLRDSFVNTLAHDLQVPIVGDITALEFLASRPDNQTIGQLREIINETINNDKRILTILKRLLSSYEYDSGKKVLTLVKAEWSQTINNAIEPLSELARKKAISIKTEIPDKLPEIFIDKEEIDKLLSIFLENAVIYTQNGGEVIIRTSIQNNYLKTCIFDNGPGIPEHIKFSIFKRYEMSALIKRKIGAGISLYLAKQIAEAHGGNVSFKSESGKGSTFCVSLPIY